MLQGLACAWVHRLLGGEIRLNVELIGMDGRVMSRC